MRVKLGFVTELIIEVGKPMYAKLNKKYNEGKIDSGQHRVAKVRACHTHKKKHSSTHGALKIELSYG